MKPKTPASCSGARSARLPGTAPPQKPTSTRTWPSATARFSSSAATVVVGGTQLSGMSTIVVTPPAAAARVAVAKPSHSVRPGSLTCTWVSTSPGSSTSSSARSTMRSAAGGSSYAVTEVIRSPVMPTHAEVSAPPTTSRSLLHTAQKNGYDFPLLAATIETNEEQPKRFIKTIEDTLGGFDKKKIAVLGLAFKANTDDMRDAKSLMRL